MCHPTFTFIFSQINKESKADLKKKKKGKHCKMVANAFKKANQPMCYSSALRLFTWMKPKSIKTSIHLFLDSSTQTGLGNILSADSK